MFSDMNAYEVKFLNFIVLIPNSRLWRILHLDFPGSCIMLRVIFNFPFLFDRSILGQVTGSASVGVMIC